MRFFHNDADTTPRKWLKASRRRATILAVIGLAIALLALGIAMVFT